MLNRNELNKYADILLWGMETARGQNFEPRDIVLIRYDLSATNLAEILFDKILQRGIHPLQRMNVTPSMEQAFFSRSQDYQLSFISPGEEELMNHLNGSISLLAPSSLTHLQDVNPENIGKAIVAKKKLRDILDERENFNEFGWTLCLLATEELAKCAGLSLEEYCNQIKKACFLDYPDPVQKWKEVFQQAEEIKTALNNLQAEYFHVQSDNCDLWITPGESRRWVGISGHNIPSFELFISPDWRGTKGFYYMDQPSFRNGNMVRNLRLEFEQGQVKNMQAEEGEEFVKKQLRLDSNADKLGEFSLTDKRFSRIDKFMAHTLFDENFGGDFGNCHIALGASYSETYALGGKNLNKELKENLGFNDSALHWDLVNTEKKLVTAILPSGKKQNIYENGQFLI